jgi:hypothetical protein
MGRGEADPAEAVACFERLCGQGLQSRAVELARRVLERHPDQEELALHVARALAAGGEAEGAWWQLAPLIEGPSPSPAALMLAGEVAEGQGELRRALALYEQILARDIDYPGARERVHRLQETREPREGIAGATLMVDGALARGRYRLEHELGRGGAGTVFSAWDCQLERPVALKVYHRRGRADRERLRMEARTPARFEHPGVIRVFDLDERLGAIAMERLPGGSVRLELGKEPVPVGRVERWLQTALEALAFVHARGWVHRDLKPSNLLLRGDDRTVLTDFGLATRIGEAPPLRGGAGEGTLGYMPPEQQGGAPAQPSADIHAFGATMAELVQCLAGPVPEAWQQLPEACMRHEPAKRPAIGWLLQHVQGGV